MAFNLSHVGDELTPKEHCKPFFGLGSSLVLETFVGGVNQYGVYNMSRLGDRHSQSL